MGRDSRELTRQVYRRPAGPLPAASETQFAYCSGIAMRWPGDTVEVSSWLRRMMSAMTSRGSDSGATLAASCQRDYPDSMVSYSKTTVLEVEFATAGRALTPSQAAMPTRGAAAREVKTTRPRRVR